MRNTLSFWLYTMALVATNVLAQPDPTRPPAAYLADSFDAAGAGQAPLLQSVILPRTGRPAALIGGQYVGLGGYFGEKVLVDVRENSVVLQGVDGREVLSLTPGVEKKILQGKPAAVGAAVNVRSGLRRKEE